MEIFLRLIACEIQMFTPLRLKDFNPLEKSIWNLLVIDLQLLRKHWDSIENQSQIDLKSLATTH